VVSTFIKFEFGMLVGTIVGSAVSALICSIAFEFYGFENTKLPIIQQCIEMELHLNEISDQD
tara:strand:+ start:462 stop:647 length:186 start_codon:yes stop_codon:yes gene_type:complete